MARREPIAETAQRALALDETPAAADAGALRGVDWPGGLDAVSQDWRPTLDTFFGSAQGQRLASHLRARIAQGAVIHPPEPLRAFALTPLREVRVVILGQDPYHGPGQAEGLAFSVAPGVKIPPSLANIFRELQRDLGTPPAANGSLVRWARQGVLLLNTSLTVEDGAPASHAGLGWEALTDAVVEAVARASQPVVFMLWGAHAQAKGRIVEREAPDGRHLVLKANHPSPLSARRPPLPFLGCGHFGLAARALAASGRGPVDW